MITEMTKIEINNEFKDNVTNLIQCILDKTFISGPKTKIHGGYSRLNFACPYCGDSVKDETKKRGNLFWNTLFYHCYNDGCKEHKTLNDLFTDFGISDFKSSDRLAVINYIKANSNKFSTTKHLEFELFQKLIKLSIPKTKFLEMTNSKPIHKDGPGYDILKERLLIHKLENFSYRYNRLFIMNLTPDGKNVISYQIRKLNVPDNGNKYLTFNLEKLRELATLTTLDECKDEAEVDQLNKLSTIFNILNVDFTKTTTSFEGPIDSYFMRNSIGQASVNRDMTMFDEVPTVRYFFDNDKAGLEAAREQLRKGHYVFMWHKFIKDYNLEKYVIEKKLKDLNDIMKICFRDKLSAYKYLENYFSNNSLDLYNV